MGAALTGPMNLSETAAVLDALSTFPIEVATESIALTRWSVVAVYCIALCEWLHALPKEVDLIWPSRWNSIKLAYFLCRYYSVLTWPIVIYAYVLDHSIQTCSRLTHAVNYTLLPMQCFAHAVMLMRAYGFTGRNRKALVLLCTCLAGLIGVNVWFFCVDVPQLADLVYEVLGGTGCFPDYSATSDNLRIGLEMAAAVFMDLISLLVIVLYRIQKGRFQGSLSRVFVNQGLLAFGCMLAVNATALGSYYNPDLYHNGMALPYILILPNVVACRVIISLRTKARPSETELDRQHSALIEDELANYDDFWTTRMDEDG
ncbi:unnamed protein product [Mycena citricolor]|uniref:DUF6533 domain-containing protein n=1 Tax=Mycena citricolor TaxID=2018698 RepID=A0AAD2HBT1_9AGAR|nr:unnamed protein product [Mycena citricolor]